MTNYVPEFSGLSDITIPQGGSANIQVGVSASDYEDDDVSASIVYPTTDLTSLSVGTHTITYIVSDSHANTTTQQRNVIVLANTAPVITGVSDEVVAYEDVEDYNYLEGVSVSDDHTTLTTADITVSGSISVPSAGTQTQSVITYRVEDAQGNDTEVSKTITVTNYVPEFSGLSDITIIEGDVYDLLEGVSAYDYEDGDMTLEIVCLSDVQSLNVGEHEVIYTITDSHGNEVRATRFIHIQENTQLQEGLSPSTFDTSTSSYWLSLLVAAILGMLICLKKYNEM